MKTDRLTIRLDPEIAIEVKRIATAEHLTKAAVVSRALWSALKPGPRGIAQTLAVKDVVSRLKSE